MTMTALLGWVLVVAGLMRADSGIMIAGAVFVLVGAVDELRDKLR